MEADIKRMTKVLHHITLRELGNDEIINRYFGLLSDITSHLKDVLDYDDDKLKYDRTRWIDRGSEAGWWESPMDYERETDLETLAILLAQMMKFQKLIKKN